MTDAVTDRHPIDQLADEFVARRRRGERPTVQEYACRYPEYATDILELFPAMCVMEGVGQPAADAGRPERLGDFRIVREIGRGGMGVVYEAVHEPLGRRVALKVLPRPLKLTAKVRQRFDREVRAAARLHHTHIVPVYSVEHHDDCHFFVMQLIEGRSLDRLFADLHRDRGTPTLDRAGAAPRTDHTGPPSSDAKSGTGPPASGVAHPDADPRAYWRLVARVGAEAAEALDYAHRQGVLHRDIKPANLLLDAAGQTWVLDFGLAKVLPGQGDEDDEAVATLTATGDVLGTIRYMAPERFAGLADARSDVYSLGLTLYELLTLRPAFEAPDRVKLIHQVIHAEPAPLGRAGRRIPADLANVVARAIDKDPARRYRTAGELAADLRRFLDGRPVLARRIGPVGRAVRWARRNPTVAGLLAIIVLGTAAGFGAVMSESNAAKRNAEAHRAKSIDLAASNRRLYAVHYAAKLQLAGAAWPTPDGVRRAKELLADAMPAAGEDDLRGFEWHYLQRLCRPDRKVLRGRGGSIHGLARTADGTRVASLATDGTVRVWDPAAGEEVVSWRAHGDGGAIAFSADGTLIVTAGRESGSAGRSGSVVKFWDAKTGGALRQVATEPDFRVFAMQFNPAGEGLFVAGGKQQSALNADRPWLLVVNPQTGAVVHEVPDRGRCVAVSPDGRQVATCSIDGGVRIVDAESGADRLTLDHQPLTRGLAWSPNGRYLAAGHARGVTIWDASSGKRLGQSPDQQADVGGLDFSPDGRLLAAGSFFDGAVRLYEVPTTQEVGQLRGHDGLVSAVRFLPDGRSLVSASTDRTLAVWDLARRHGPAVCAAPETGALECVGLSADGRWAVARQVRLERTARRPVCSTIAWDVTSGRVLWSVPEWTLAQIVATPEGERVATWHDGGRVTVRDLATGAVLVQVSAGPGTVRKVFLTTDGRQMVCIRHDRETVITVRDGQTGAAQRERRMAIGFPQHLALSPDGRFLAAAAGSTAAGRRGFELAVLNVETGERVMLARRDDDGHLGVLSVAFSPDGGRLVTTHSREARVWTVSTGEERRLRGHTLLVRKAVFSPDGRRLATAGFDHRVKLWDLETGQEVLTLTGDAVMHGVAFDAAGTRLAAGCGSRILVWDGRPLPAE